MKSQGCQKAVITNSIKIPIRLILQKFLKEKIISMMKNKEQFRAENIVARNFKNRGAFEVLRIDITCLKHNNQIAYLCILQDMKTTEIIFYTPAKNYATPMVLNTVTEGFLKFRKEIKKN